MESDPNQWALSDFELAKQKYLCESGIKQ